MNKTLIIVFSLILLNIILIAILIFRKPLPVIKPVDDTKQIEEIKRLESLNDSLSNIILEQENIRDSIIVYKDKIKVIYREKYIHINKSNAVQLDSIIRASIN